ncbi:MAG: general secretion pathway protein GspF [Flavobacteriales bacterium]|nr:MAG: general secretion pathway protein GspF [Flavobacteriales bacterium]
MSIELQDIQIKQPKPLSRKKANGKSVLDMLNHDIKLFSFQLSDKKKERFYSELNILFSAGVDIISALELIETEQSKKEDKKVFSQIKQHILKGGSMSEAIEKAGNFSSYECYSIKIGEESGKLPQVLTDLSIYFNIRIKQKRQVITALSYPSVVFLTAIGAIFFMLNFIVPMFSDVFKRFGGDLPSITKFIILLSEILSAYAAYGFLTVLAFTVFFFMQRKRLWFRKLFSQIILTVPFFGTIIQKTYLARFCNSMNLLMAANTPLIEALKLVEKMVSFYPLEHSLRIVQEKVLHGSSLHHAMSEFSIYNKRMVSLVKVAEEVNQLDLIFEKLAKQYGDEVDHQTGLLSSTLEPLLIIFIGLFVALILMAMYLPLFGLSTSIG